MVRSSAVGVIAGLALFAAACGSDDAAAPGDAAPATTVGTAPTTTVSEEPVRTTIPLVTVPAEASTAPSSTARPADADPDVGSGDRADPADPAEPADPGDPVDPGNANPPAPTFPPSGIPDIDEVLGGEEVIDPPEGAGTAMRATISPVTGLAVGDVVTIEAENAPPGQYMAWSQCSEAATESVDIGVLLTSCDVFGGGGFGFSDPDGTVSVTVTVADRVGGTDCRVGTCVVGLVVFPGTDGLRVYEPITLAG